MYFTWLHPYRLQEKCREMIRLRILHFFIVPVLRLHMRFPDFHIPAEFPAEQCSVLSQSCRFPSCVNEFRHFSAFPNHFCKPENHSVR